MCPLVSLGPPLWNQCTKLIGLSILYGSNWPIKKKKTMHLPHILPRTIRNGNMHTSVMTGVLWGMAEVYCGICENSLLLICARGCGVEDNWKSAPRKPRDNIQAQWPGMRDTLGPRLLRRRETLSNNTTINSLDPGGCGPISEYVFFTCMLTRWTLGDAVVMKCWRCCPSLDVLSSISPWEFTGSYVDYTHFSHAFTYTVKSII